MAKLQRLQITGIRNFGPDDKDIANIKFYSPLTLFLGENGSGKTTIIEALKFACTGELPGGSRNGQGFIHNPKINSTVSTKGQVRLKITDAKGNEVMVLKSAQVEQRRDKIKFETLDSTLAITKPNGEKTQISSRCSDIGKQFCQMIGVSKPILNYVIFCHQDDSLWPLDEGKALKEKFDKIFDIDSYNKCVESIRKLIKEKKVAIQILKESVAAKKIKKESVERFRNQLQEKKLKLSSVKEDINAKKEKIIPKNNHLKEICELESNINSLDKVITEKESTKKSLQIQQNNITSNLNQEYKGTDNELKKEIDSFETNTHTYNCKIEVYSKNKKDLEKKREELLTNVNKKQVRIGELNAQKNQHQQNIKKRNEIFKKTLQMLNLSNFNDVETDENANSALISMENEVVKTKTKLEVIVKDKMKEEKDLQNNIDQIREKKAKIHQEIKSNQNQIKEIKVEIQRIKNQLHDMQLNEMKSTKYKSKLVGIDKDLENLEKSFDCSQINSNIEERKRNIKKLEENLDVLKVELRILQKNYVFLNEIESKKSEILKREYEIVKLKNKHNDNFIFLFNEVPEQDFKLLLETKKQNASKQKNEYSNKITQKQSEVTKLETELSIRKRELNSLKEKLKINEQKINELCQGREYNEISKELHQEIERLQKHKGQYSSAKIMYEKYIKDFQKEKPCCPVCDTSFIKNNEAVQEIIKTLKDKIKEIPQQLLNIEDNLLKKQELYNKVLQLGGVYEEQINLSNERIPKISSDINNLNSNLNEKKNELKDFQKKIDIPKEIYDICTVVISDAIIIDQNQIEVQKLKENVEMLESKLVKVPSSRTLQKAEAEIEDIEADISNERSLLDTQQRKLNQNNERKQNLREEKNKLMKEQLVLEKTMQSKPQLEKQLKEYEEKNVKLMGDIEPLNVKLDDLSNDLDAAEENLEVIKKTNITILDSLRSEFNESRKMIEECSKINNLIKDYYKQNINQQFETAVEELADLRQKEKDLNLEIQSTDENINKLKFKLENLKSKYKELNDNVLLRKLRQDEVLVTRELEDLKQQRGNLGYEALNQQKIQLQKEIIALEREINICRGNKAELENSISELKIELEKPENKFAYSEFKKKYFEYKLTEKIVLDLQYYVMALERALMEFHKEGMANVNKIIREYWRSVYRGNDIDYIEIKNEATSTNINALKRTYDYRVVQMKNGVELDMRGYCSAGQKVLACLIIRIALAETFSHNCGILALDEPTTNLDRENIRSLSNVLARIINTRQDERNFQLLIITHDEEFLHDLTQVDKLSYYYKVSRDRRGKSVITREML